MKDFSFRFEHSFFRNCTSWIFTCVLVGRVGKRNWLNLEHLVFSHNKFQLADSRFPRSQISPYHRNLLQFFAIIIYARDNYHRDVVESFSRETETEQ